MSDQQQILQVTTSSDATRNDRFSAVLVIIVAVAGIALGLSLRQRTLSQVWLFRDQQTGIEATYPAGWLTDQSGEYVARIQDPKARPFKTRYLIDVVPGGGATSVRNVLDGLTLQRSIDLPAYRVLDIQEVTLGGANATQMDFVFVQADPNPFIERVPVVVRGRDFVIIDGNRAIVVTLMSDEVTFDQNQDAFLRFLGSLRY